MLEVKQMAASSSAVRESRVLHLFLHAHLYRITGMWTWSLMTEAIFCSDVMFALSGDLIPEGTKTLMHPEDIQAVQTMIRQVKAGKAVHAEFRLITTYGNTETVQAAGLFECVEIDGFTAKLEHLAIEAQGAIKNSSDESRHLQTLAAAYQQSEKFFNFGAYYINITRLEVFYSDEVFKIHGIPAQSLNAHFHTFHSFIHPSDHEQAVHFLETGYKTQIPLELEYRIIVNGRETRYIAHTTRWTVNEKGDEILMGIIKDVTAQHRREQENQELRNQMMLSVKALQHAENFSRIGSFNLNVVTRKFEYSDQVYRMLGLRNTGILLNASTFLKYVHPDDQEKMAEVNRKMLLDQTAPDMEFRIIRPDGKTRYLRQKGKLIIDKNEEMVILGTIMDTTEKEIAAIRLHQLSHELHLQQLKLHHMEEVSGSAGWIWNTHTGDIQWSKGIYDLLGFKGMGVQMNQKLFMSFIHPEDKKLFSNSIASMLHGETASSFMFRISRKNEIRWIHADFRLETREDENYFSAIFQDRSEIVALRDEFTEHLQMLDLLMDSLNDCMFVTDLHHNILKWNRKSEIEFGIRKDKAVDQNLFDLLPHLKKKNILHAYQQANLGETAILPDERSSLNNAIETIRIHPVKDADGHVKAVFTLIHDQTGESQLRQQLTERLKFIEKLLQFSVDRIIVLDKKMNYLYWNRKAEQYYGIPQKEVVGRNILELFPGFIDDPSYTEFRKVLRGETVHIPAVRNLEDKKGYFETYLIPVKDDNEEVIAVLWIVHDLLSEYHLAQHQRKATHILQSINEAYVELDAEGKLRFVNAMAETLWKRPKEELLGFTLHEIFHDQISPDMLSGIQKALGSKSPCKGEYWMTNSQRWFYVSCTPSTDSMIMLFYDITEVKQARENLFLSQQLAREHQDMLAQTAIASPDAITIYDLEQRQPIYLNNCLSRWTGFSNEELVAMGYEGRLQLIHPEDRKRLEVFNEGLLSAEDQEVKIIEYRLKTPRGLFWIRNRGKVFRKDGQGKPTHVLSVLQDFSEEMKLREQLMERTRYAEAIIDASIDRIAVCDRNLHLIAWNQRSELATGFRKEYVMGRNISEILPEVLQERKIAEALEDARNGQYAYLPPMKTSFSSQLCERFYIPLEDEGGDVYAVLIIMHDVTDLVHKEDELRDLNRLLEHKNTELEQKHEEITNFAFVASHDLKEPLRKIHTFSDWLIQHEAEQLSSVGRNFIDKMMSAVRRMEMLIDDILVLTRIHSDVDRVEETDLNTVLSDVCADIHEWIEKSHTDISADPLPRIQANRNQVFYLFRNLVSNAIKFQRPGNVPRIRITADKVEKDAAGHQAEGGFLRISFSDNGFGFNPRYSRKIFQVFQKLHDKYEFEGTGIGLAICKKIMENHHGSITADSEIGKGSVFSCYFPLEPR